MSTPELTILERIRIQMEYAVPLLRDLQELLGEESVNAALVERLRTRTQKAKDTCTNEADMSRMALGTEQFAAGEALEYEIIESDSERFDMNVTRCRYAQMMEQLGAREIGHLLICNGDFEAAERVGMELTRTQTCMQGADFCDFRYRKRS